jgi:hypothetical protein
MIGSIVLATNQGLGYLAKAFYDNGIIDLVEVKQHTTRENNYKWYPGHVNRETLLDKCDTLIFLETPFDWKVIVQAIERGIKTILIPMYECTRYPFPYQPDEIWCPSDLDYKFYTEKGEVCKKIQIPVDAKWKLREKARVFVHNAGNGGLGGRNGTQELLQAMQYVKSPIKLIVRSQVDIKKVIDPRIEYVNGTRDNIWEEGDVFIFPEKFNGLSLPLQEAFASGFLVMAGARYPMTEWLPNEPLIPVESYHKESIAVPFDCADYDPKTIAKIIDEWYNVDITKFSLMGKEWGEKNSWKKLKETFKM